MSELSRNGRSTITRDTLIPLGLVIVLAGAIFSYSTMYAEVQSHAVEIKKLQLHNENRDERNEDRWIEVSGRLSNIEGALGVSRGHK